MKNKRLIFIVLFLATCVSSYLIIGFLLKIKRSRKIETSPNVQKWIGVLKSEKTYKEMREEIVSQKLKKYEDFS